jgi:uncharacterized protein (DUF433 family)
LDACVLLVPVLEFLDDFPTVKREQAVAALECTGDLLTAGAHSAQ